VRPNWFSNCVPPSFPLLRRLRSQAGLRLHFWRRALRVSRLPPGPDRPGLAVFGEDSQLAQTALDYLGADHARPAWRSRLLPVGRAALAQRYLRRDGLVVFESVPVPASLQPEALPLEHYVELDVTLPPDQARFFSSLGDSVKSDRRLIRRAQFRPEYTRSTDLLAAFHARYVVPSVPGRHGAAALVPTLPQLLTLHAERGGELLRIFRGDAWVSGVFCLPGPQAYNLWSIGWRAGDPCLLKDGAIAACYVFSFQRAYELALPRVELGGTPANLEDGLFYFKSKWGPRLRPAATAGTFTRHVLLDPSHPACRRYLSSRSLLIQRPDGTYLVLSGRDPAEVPVHRVHADRLSAWFRLRAVADPAPDPAKAALPASLRPWFDALALS